jgi:hypothetical protein
MRSWNWGPSRSLNQSQLQTLGMRDHRARWSKRAAEQHRLDFVEIQPVGHSEVVVEEEEGGPVRLRAVQG